MAKKDLFLERYRELGHNLTGAERTRQAIRVNPLKASNEELVRKLGRVGVKLTRVDFLDHGFYVEGSRFSLGASFEYLLGLYSLQEAAAQFPVKVLDPRSGDIVLDMCAAPGGKTTQIAAAMGNGGAVVAVDVSRRRLYALENNLERCGIVNCAVYCDDVNEMDFKDVRFDRILLDAPCSGNYVTDRGWFNRRDLRDVSSNAERQRSLLRTGMGLLKEGGTLVYTTCSLEPEENELNAQWLLDDWPHFETDRKNPDEVYGLWKPEVEALHDLGRYFGLTCHPECIGRASRLRMLERLLGEMKEKGDVWFPTGAELAEHVRSKRR